MHNKKNHYKAHKLTAPRQSPDAIAAEFKSRNPQEYQRWRQLMLNSAKHSLRSYQHQLNSHPVMSLAEFRQHLHRTYETAIVNQAYEELGMPGPCLATRTNRRALKALTR